MGFYLFFFATHFTERSQVLRLDPTAPSVTQQWTCWRGCGRKICVEELLSSAALGRGCKDARTTIPGHCSYLPSLLLCVVCSFKDSVSRG